MIKIVDIRANISYFKSKEGVMIKNTELVLLAGKPSYKYVGDKPEKFIKIKETRIDLTENDFNLLIEHLTLLKNASEKDFE